MSNTTKSSRNQRRLRQQQDRQQARRTRTLVIGAAVGAFLLVVLFFTWEQTTGSRGLDPDQVADPTLGAAGAAVEIVEYGDFGCPACRAWHNAGIREEIMRNYGDQVRFVWRDFPVITPQSPKAAEAAQCAGVQGQFWAYHDALYDGAAGISSEALVRYATQVGLDEAIFAACLEGGRWRGRFKLASSRRVAWVCAARPASQSTARPWQRRPHTHSLPH
ncbi:MAG: thioredoxin domain-containing protein [Caldilineaceae bacterium]|nr:thioredoxin domain-containing protein [Caldilineaceae bacterium]